MIAPAHVRYASIEAIKADPYFSGVEWAQLRASEPPFVPQLDNEVDTSYFELEGVAEADIARMIKELEGGAAGAPRPKRNIIAGFTFKPADVEKMRAYANAADDKSAKRLTGVTLVVRFVLLFVLCVVVRLIWLLFV